MAGSAASAASTASPHPSIKEAALRAAPLCGFLYGCGEAVEAAEAAEPAIARISHDFP